MQVGSALEVILLSLALADRINVMQLEKAQADAYFNDQLKELNHSLEEKVKQRTTDLEIKNRMLQEMASHDGLTGLLNRRAFINQAKLLLADAQRYQYSLSLLMMDIDYFKQVNDDYGHQVGDIVLTEVSKLLATDSRSSDILVRYGGEEFILLLPHANKDYALLRAERLLKVIFDMKVSDYPSVKISVSFGISWTDEQVESVDIEQLIKWADDALYRAKDQGRNQACMMKPVECLTCCEE